MPGDLVLDQFASGGTTFVEAKLLNRNIIGEDIKPITLQRCKEKSNFECNSNSVINIMNGDAKELHYIDECSIDFICTHPPYANIIKYSNDKNDISYLDEKEFIFAMEQVEKERKYCVMMMGDIRKKVYVIPLGLNVMQTFLKVGFMLKELIIKE